VRVSSYRVSNYRSGCRVQPHGPAAHERALARGGQVMTAVTDATAFDVIVIGGRILRAR
jgi:hypothetical protein